MGPNENSQAPGDHLGIGGNYQPGYEGRLLFFNGNERGQTLIGRTIIEPGTWNHVVLIRDGSHVTAYLNGRDQPEFTGKIDVTAPDAKDFFLGARSDNFAPFQGTLAEFAIFDYVLKPGEVSLLHQTAAPQAFQAIPAGAKLSPETPPLSPEESLKKIHVPVGYHVEDKPRQGLVVAGYILVLVPYGIVALSALLYCSSKMMERAQHITKIDLLDSSQGYLHVSLKGTVLYRVRKVEDHMADKIMTHGGHLRCGASPFNWCAC